MSTSKTTTTRTTVARKSAASKTATTARKTAPRKPKVSGAVDSALEAAKALSAGRKPTPTPESTSEADTAGPDTAAKAPVSEAADRAPGGTAALATLRKKAFIDAVARRSGVKRGDAKTAVEAALAELGEAIAAGRDINLPGLGKLKVNRSKHLANAEVFIAKIRQPKAEDGAGAGTASETPGTKDAATPKDPLAEAAE